MNTESKHNVFTGIVYRDGLPLAMMKYTNWGDDCFALNEEYARVRIKNLREWGLPCEQTEAALLAILDEK